MSARDCLAHGSVDGQANLVLKHTWAPYRSTPHLERIVDYSEFTLNAGACLLDLNASETSEN